MKQGSSGPRGQKISPTHCFAPRHVRHPTASQSSPESGFAIEFDFQTIESFSSKVPSDCDQFPLPTRSRFSSLPQCDLGVIIKRFQLFCVLFQGHQRSTFWCVSAHLASCFFVSWLFSRTHSVSRTRVRPGVSPPLLSHTTFCCEKTRVCHVVCVLDVCRPLCPGNTRVTFHRQLSFFGRLHPPPHNLTPPSFSPSNNRSVHSSVGRLDPTDQPTDCLDRRLSI